MKSRRNNPHALVPEAIEALQALAALNEKSCHA